MVKLKMTSRDNTFLGGRKNNSIFELNFSIDKCYGFINHNIFDSEDKHQNAIKIETFFNEEKLKKYGIKYEIDKELGIIPIGVVDFFEADEKYMNIVGETDKYSKNYLSLSLSDLSNAHLYEMYKNNIIEAIKRSYNGYEFLGKLDKNTEEIDLEL